jgi:hypothetical protein
MAEKARIRQLLRESIVKHITALRDQPKLVHHMILHPPKWEITFRSEQDPLQILGETYDGEGYIILCDLIQLGFYRSVKHAGTYHNFLPADIAFSQIDSVDEDFITDILEEVEKHFPDCYEW